MNIPKCHSGTMLAIVLLLLALGALAITSQRVQAQCRDGAGNIIPCPGGGSDGDGNAPPPPENPNTDRDEDGIPDVHDWCAYRPGPAETEGCPPGHPYPNDTDGDGVKNDLDACPDEIGPPENNGCPEGQSAGNEAPGSEFVLPALPADGPCVIATRGSQRVNVRSETLLSNPDNIVGQIEPSQTDSVPYLLFELERAHVSSFQIISPGEEPDPATPLIFNALVKNENISGSWYLINHMEQPAFAFADVIRQGGDCDQLPAVQASYDPIQMTVMHQPFSYMWQTTEDSAPGINFDENGMPLCDAVLQELIACDGSAHTVDGANNTIFFTERLLRHPDVVDGVDFLMWQDGPASTDDDALSATELDQIADSFFDVYFEIEVPQAQGSNAGDQDSWFDADVWLSEDSCLEGEGCLGIGLPMSAPHDDSSAAVQYKTWHCGSTGCMEITAVHTGGIPAAGASLQDYVFVKVNDKASPRSARSSLLIMISPVIEQNGQINAITAFIDGSAIYPESDSQGDDILFGGHGLMYLIGSPADPNMSGLVVIAIQPPNAQTGQEKWFRDSISVWW